MLPDSLTQGQFDTVYNLLSLVIASQLFTTLYLLVVQPRVLARYRQALVVSAIVCGIAAYHYFRIFNSFTEAYVTDAVGGKGIYTQAVGHSFNEGYRYVDWLLTVPLLLVELVVVLTLAKALQASLLRRLIPAAALMIALGYPGELSTDGLTRNVFGLASTDPVPVHPLRAVRRAHPLAGPPARRRPDDRLADADPPGGHVGRLPDRVPASPARLRRGHRLGRQAGRLLVADILAKALYGLLIFKIARMKSFADDPTFAAVEGSHEEARDTTIDAGTNHGEPAVRV